MRIQVAKYFFKKTPKMLLSETYKFQVSTLKRLVVKNYSKCETPDRHRTLRDCVQKENRPY